MRYSKSVLVFFVLMLLASFTVTATAETKLTWYFCCAQKERADMFNAWAREFEQLNPGVVVEPLYPVTGGEVYYDKIKVAVAGDMAPDVMWAGNGLWGMADLLMPIDDLYNSDANIHEIIPAIINAHRWNGKLIAAPFGVNTHAFYYNRDLLSTAGVAMPRDWTWDQAIALTQKIQLDADGNGIPERFGLAFSETAHALMYGGNVYSDDFRKVLLDNPVTTAGIQMTSDLITNKFNNYYSISNPVALTGFYGGTLGMISKGVFDIPTMKKNALFDWDVQMFPKFVMNGKEYRTSYFSQETWAIYKDTKIPQLVKKFLSFIMQKEHMGAMAAGGMVIPTQPSVATRYFLNTNQPANIRAFTDTLNWYKNSDRQNPADLRIDAFATWKAIISGTTPAGTGVPELTRQMQVRLDEYWAARQ